jgi:hypothetical protein
MNMSNTKQFKIWSLVFFHLVFCFAVYAQQNSPTKKQLVGNYAGEDTDGLYYMLTVELNNNLLKLGYRPGGASTFNYNELNLEEKKAGKEYTLTTEDLNKNGELIFSFIRNAVNEKFSVLITDPNDPGFEGIQLKLSEEF